MHEQESPEEKFSLKCSNCCLCQFRLRNSKMSLIFYDGLLWQLCGEWLGRKVTLFESVDVLDVGIERNEDFGSLNWSPWVIRSTTAVGAKMEEMPVCKTITLEKQDSECATAMQHKHTDGKHQDTLCTLLRGGAERNFFQNPVLPADFTASAQTLGVCIVIVLSITMSQTLKRWWLYRKILLGCFISSDQEKRSLCLSTGLEAFLIFPFLLVWLEVL